MPRIFDRIEYFDDTGQEMVHKFPEYGSGDFHLGSQLTVRESQAAVFFRNGKALDVFGPGMHTLTTENIPLLKNLLGLAFDGRSPFTAEVYFVSLQDFIDMKWGTPQPIVLRNPNVGLGIMILAAFGSYSIQVSDPQLFVNKIVGTQGLVRTKDIGNYLRGIIVNKLTDLLGELQKSILDLQGMVEEIGAGVKAKAQDDFAALGLQLKSIYITSLRPSDKSIDELRSMGLLDIDTYTRLQMADATRDAAQQPGGGMASAGVGLGAGMTMAQMMAQSMGQQQQAAPAAPAAEDPMAKLKKLKAMFEADLISQEEYDAKKKQILDAM